MPWWKLLKCVLEWFPCNKWLASSLRTRECWWQKEYPAIFLFKWAFIICVRTPKLFNKTFRIQSYSAINSHYPVFMYFWLPLEYSICNCCKCMKLFYTSDATSITITANSITIPASQVTNAINFKMVETCNSVTASCSRRLNKLNKLVMDHWVCQLITMRMSKL